MKAASLASGSKGNSYLIQTDKTKILIDEGIGEKELLEKLYALKVNPEDISAIFITHEHDDHIKGLQTFLKKYNPKIYIHPNSATVANKKLKNILTNVKLISDGEGVDVGDLFIENFKQSHDSKHCVGYSVSSNDAKVSISTDLGTTDSNILGHLCYSNLVYLEANHDINMLIENQHYPVFLKQRILSDKGHLSNKKSGEVISALSKTNVGQIVLSHLSEENNTPNLAYSYIKDYLKTQDIIEGRDIFIDVALQHKIGTIFNITKK